MVLTKTLNTCMRHEEDLMEPSSVCPPVKSLVRLQRLYVEELFGPGSNPIDIAFSLDERVTVLHGRNGAGKTITLRLLQALREGSFDQLEKYPFRRVELSCTDGTGLRITRAPNEKSQEKRVKAPGARFSPPPFLPLVPRFLDHRGSHSLSGPAGHKEGAAVSLQFQLLTPAGSALWVEPVRLSEAEQDALTEKLRSAGRFYPVGSNRWTDAERNHEVSTTQLLLNDPDLFEESSPESRALLAFLRRLPQGKFITTERLGTQQDSPHPFIAEGDASTLTVERISQAVQHVVSEADKEYRRTSSELDGSLHERLFAPSFVTPPREELRLLNARLLEQEQQYFRLGLLAEPKVVPFDESMSPDRLGMLHILLQDRIAKLEPFQQVVQKAQRLLDTLNRKLFPKVVKLNVDRGYQVYSENGTELPLSLLSSGEQHELVLLHELLFEVSEGSLILIDEPELSLHVTWQLDFLSDIQEIARLASLDIVVATHSPYIVGDRAELMVRLGAPV